MGADLPDVRLLMVVRNPIDRVVSHVLHMFKNEGTPFTGHDMPLIDDIIFDYVTKGQSLINIGDLLELSKFSGIYERYNSKLPGRIMVVNGDELILNPFEEIRFLGKVNILISKLCFQES